jgi:hypothetical protein
MHLDHAPSPTGSTDWESVSNALRPKKNAGISAPTKITTAAPYHTRDGLISPNPEDSVAPKLTAAIVTHGRATTG